MILMLFLLVIFSICPAAGKIDWSLGFNPWCFPIFSHVVDVKKASDSVYIADMCPMTPPETGYTPEDFKSGLTDPEKKISTGLLQLIGELPLSHGQTIGSLKSEMEKSGQFIPHSSAAATKGDRHAGSDLIYVYIRLSDGTDTRLVDPYVWNITGRDESNHLAVAWVETGRLIDLASRNEVSGISPVEPPAFQNNHRVVSKATVSQPVSKLELKKQVTTHDPEKLVGNVNNKDIIYLLDNNIF